MNPINPLIARQRILELTEECKRSPDRATIERAMEELNEIAKHLEKDSKIAEHLALLCADIFKLLIKTLNKEEFESITRTMIGQNPKLAVEVMLENMTPEEIEKVRERALAEVERRRLKLVKK